MPAARVRSALDFAAPLARTGRMTARIGPGSNEYSGDTPGDRPVEGVGAADAPDRALERALGTQIRDMRRGLDLSVADLAHAAGISTGMLSKIENGQISPSLATLQSISSALSVPLSSLFASFEDRQDCSYVRAGQGVTIERRGTKVGHVYQLLGHALRSDIAVEPYLITLRQNAAPYTGFHHSGVEFIYMIEGEIGYRHGADIYELKPGDALLFDSTALHGPEVLKSPTSRYLSIIVHHGPRAAQPFRD